MPTLLETLASYLPTLIVRQHTGAAEAPHEPARMLLPGALLFADISGFTVLTERLAHHGPSGVEELTRLLNISFGQILDTIETSGGDVITFAGDALLALWPATEESLADATLRAAECALLIHRRVANFYRLIDSTPLALRIGIAAGELTTLRIGGLHGRWEFLVTGDPLVEVGIAEACAQPGAVVLAPMAWALIQHCCDGTSVREPTASTHSRTYMRLNAISTPPVAHVIKLPVLHAGMDAALRSYIPAAVLGRIVAGQTDWLAELRRVTVIFANLPMINHNTPLDQAQRVMQALQAALYRYEGSINKISLDDKGVILVAALGLPPLAHEDDAIRGVQAALAIRQALTEQNLPCAIGVTSGRAFCGEIGSLKRREYTMIGDVVNLAARLMQAAIDQPIASTLLCDEATYLAARSRLDFVSLPPMVVKGKLEPVAVYRPQRSLQVGGQSLDRHIPGAQSVLSSTQIVGRHSEQAQLASQLQALRAGLPGGIVLIEAEAGMGKSYLIEAVRHLAASMQLTAFVGSGDATERSTPYYAWRSIFSPLFDLTILTAPEARRAHILSLLEDEDQILPLASLLNAVLPLDLPETDTTAQMSGFNRADATRALLLQLLQDSVSRSPKLLVLEDAHWFDSASWALALAVSQRIRPLLLIITMRPLGSANTHASIAPEYQQLAASAQLHLTLDALAPDAVLMLVCQRLGVRVLPEAAAVLIREKAQGNPFFSEELAFALRDTGLLQIEGDQCSLAPHADLGALSFPETVQGAIISRIDRLAPTQQLTLKVASVIGRVFPLRTLEAVYPIHTMLGGLADDLATLAQLDITPLDAIEPELAYSFKHATTQDVVYNLMLFAQRRQLHRAVAEWYERAYADDLAWLYPLLAYHWSKAGVVGRALDYFEHAGRHALSISAVGEARALAEQAVALLSSDPTHEPQRRMRLTSLLGEAYQQLGQFTAAQSVLKQSLTLARMLGDHNGTIDALSLLGRVATDIGAYTEARSFLEEGRQLAYTIGDVMRMAQALSNLGNVGMRQGADDESERNYQEALALFTKLGNRPGVALVMNGLGNNAVDRGLYDVAEYCYQESMTIRRALGDRWGLASSLSNLGWVAHLQHKYSVARAHYEQSLLITRDIGDQRGTAIVLNNLGFTDYALGDGQAAARCFDEALMIATTIGATPLVLEVLVGIARLRAQAGNLIEAAELLGLALSHPAVNSDVRTQGELFLGELGQIVAASDLAMALERGQGRDLALAVQHVRIAAA